MDEKMLVLKVLALEARLLQTAAQTEAMSAAMRVLIQTHQNPGKALRCWQQGLANVPDAVVVPESSGLWQTYLAQWLGQLTQSFEKAAG